MKIIKIFSIIFFSVLSFGLGALFFVTQEPWVDFSILQHYNPGKPSIVYDDTGAEWTRFQLDRREIISIKNIPDHVIKAFLAAEDWNFFNHAGISYKGILRSFIVNLCKGRKAQGASTITQQLAKLLFFDASKSYVRKIKEQIIAIIIERQFTKEHILETYLNHICFGNAIYGVEAASQRFWAKSASQITIDEAATLACIVRCPQLYCPLYKPEVTQQRRNIVLNSMYKLNFISKEQYEEAIQKPVTIVKNDSGSLAPHLRETLRIFLEDKFGKQKLYSGGLKIQTTINIKMQTAAESIFKSNILNLRNTIAPDIDGALISIEGNTGAIKVIIGGYNFSQSQFNRAFKAKRQLGSTLKPVIYAASIEAGINLAQTDIDEPISMSDNKKIWSPRNYNHKFEGQMTLARALSTSNNIIAIKTLINTGLKRAINLMQKCGIKETMYPYPSLALGCVDGTIEDAVVIMNVFAHSGALVEPYFLLWVKDEWDTKIWKHNPTKTQALDPKIADQVASALSLMMQRVKRRLNTWINCDSIGKTGTTNDSRTCWFTGATPEFTTSVYIGCDDNRSLGNNVYAVKTAFPIWLEFNKAINCKEKHFYHGQQLEEITIDQKTGEPVAKDHPSAITILVESK